MENRFKIDSGLKLSDNTPIMDYGILDNIYIALHNKQSYAQSFMDTYRVICGYHYPFVAKTSYIGLLDILILPLLSRKILFKTFYNDNCHLLLKILAGTICFPIEIANQILAIALTIAFYPLVVIIHTIKLFVYSKQDESWLIMRAARYYDIDILKQLRDAGIDINLKYSRDYITLMDALIKKDLNIVYKLINTGRTKGALAFERRSRDDVNEPDNDNQTLLILAIKNGWIDIVNSLIKAGADVNKKVDRLYRTPLMIAVVERHLKIVQQLIKAGADVNLQDNENNTALFLLVSQINFFYARWNQPYNDQKKDEFFKNSDDIVRELINAGAYCELQNDNGKIVDNIPQTTLQIIQDGLAQNQYVLK